MPRKPRCPSCRTAGPPASNAAQPGPQNPAQHTPLPRPERDPSPPEVEPSGAERPRVRVLPSLGSPPPPVRRLPSAGGHTNRASAADRCQLPKRGAVGLLREQKRKWPRGRERRGAERLPGSRRTRRVGPRGKMATGRRGEGLWCSRAAGRAAARGLGGLGSHRGKRGHGGFSWGFGGFRSLGGVSGLVGLHGVPRGGGLGGLRVSAGGGGCPRKGVPFSLVLAGVGKAGQSGAGHFVRIRWLSCAFTA